MKPPVTRTNQTKAKSHEATGVEFCLDNASSDKIELGKIIFDEVARNEINLKNLD